MILNDKVHEEFRALIGRSAGLLPEEKADVLTGLILRIGDLNRSNHSEVFAACFEDIKQLHKQYQTKPLHAFLQQLPKFLWGDASGRFYLPRLRAIALELPSQHQTILLSKIYRYCSNAGAFGESRELLEELWHREKSMSSYEKAALVPFYSSKLSTISLDTERAHVYEGLSDAAKHLAIPQYFDAQQELFNVIHLLPNSTARCQKISEALDLISNLTAETIFSSSSEFDLSSIKSNLLSSVIRSLANSNLEVSKTTLLDRVQMEINALPPVNRLQPLQNLEWCAKEFGPELGPKLHIGVDHRLRLAADLPGKKQADYLTTAAEILQRWPASDMKMAQVEKLFKTLHALPAAWRARPLMQTVCHCIYDVGGGRSAGLGEIGQKRVDDIFFNHFVPLIKTVRPKQSALLCRQLVYRVNELSEERKMAGQESIFQLSRIFSPEDRGEVLRKCAEAFLGYRNADTAVTDLSRTYEKILNEIQILPKANQVRALKPLFSGIKIFPAGNSRQLKFIEAIKLIQELAPALELDHLDDLLTSFADMLESESSDLLLANWDEYKELCKDVRSTYESSEDFFFDIFTEKYNGTASDSLDFSVQRWAQRALTQQSTETQAAFSAKMMQLATSLPSPYIELQFKTILKNQQRLSTTDVGNAFSEFNEWLSRDYNYLERNDLYDEQFAETAQQHKLPGFFKGYLAVSDLLPGTERLTLLAQLSKALPKYPDELLPLMSDALQAKIDTLSPQLLPVLTQRIHDFARSDDESDSDDE